MRKIGVCIVFLFVSFFVQAQNSKTQAMFVYNFIRYVSWPSAYLQGDFVIGVVGNAAVYDELIAMTKGKTFGMQPIVVKIFTQIDQVSKCHMVYISDKCCKNFPEVISHFSNVATLIVTEKEGFLAQGSGISLKMVGEKLSFEISNENIRNKGLNVDKRLEMMAMR